MQANRYKKTGDRDLDAIVDAFFELDLRYEDDRFLRVSLIRELVLSAVHRFSQSRDVFRFIRRVTLEKDRRSSLSAFELVALCREYLVHFPESSDFMREIFFGTSENYTEDAASKLEYIGNKYTDEATSRFLKTLFSAKPFGVTSFEELCEDVSLGGTEYGILPIESTDNGKLLRFYSLIDKYELKISAVCFVESSDKVNTGFALVKRKIEYPHSPFGSPDMLEFFVKFGENEHLSEILTAADFCEMELYRIDSLPLSYSDGKFTFCCVFRLKESSDINSFLLYMSIAFPQYTPIGIFRHLI